MKIVCDSCGAKYSIADEKVAGKVFKIRCKKCQNIIVVRGNVPEEPAPAEPPLAEGQDFGGAADQGGDYEETPVWHLVIDREQVGPMSPSEVRDHYANGNISEETFIWREGFSDWLRLDAVDEFSDISQATKVAPAALAMGGAAGFQAPADSWGNQPESEPAPPKEEPQWDGQSAAPADAWPGEQASAAGPEAAPAPAQGPYVAPEAAAPGPDPADDAAKLAYRNPGQERRRDLFATYAGEESVSDLMGAGAPGGGIPQNAQVSFQPSGAGVDPAMGGGASPRTSTDPGFQSDPSEEADESQMTGQRNENSVLFSLGNLQALAMGKKASPEPGLGGAEVDAGGDGSGLIDIRTMAGGAGVAGGGDDLSDLGTYAAPVAAAPVLLPSMDDDRPKWLMPLIIGMAATLLVMVGLVIFLVMRKPVGPVVAQAPVDAPAAGSPQAGSPPAATEKKAAAPAKVEEKKAETAPPPAASPPAAAPGSEKTAEPAKVAAAKPKAKSAGTRRKRSSGSSTSSRKSAPSRSSDPLLGSDKKRSKSKKTTRRRSGKRDELDDLIDNAISSKPKKKARASSSKRSGRTRRSSKGSSSSAPAASSSNLPETLSRGNIQKGMRSIKGQVQGCYDRFKVPGLASVQITIGRNGRVKGAKVKGVFSGTPTGSCVKKAARGARFPKFKGTPITITYPFILR